MNDQFADLKTYKNEIAINQSFREEWVSPYYLNLINHDDDWIQQMISIKTQITNEIILKNLGDSGWRTRQTGAYFSAIKFANKYIDIIGTHLLKSEVCFAGKQYAVTLAFFNEEKSIKYLSEYLNFYLEQPHLDYDQIQVYEALQYLDEINGTKNINLHKEKWRIYCQTRINKFKKVFLKNHTEDSKEYNEALDKITNSWYINMETSRLRKKIETLNKIKDGS